MTSRQSPTVADPFAPREGKALLWRNINMIMEGTDDTALHKNILQGAWGEVPKKQTTAIMGPSGAGKTSLLSILAGRISSRGDLTVGHDIRFNNHPVDPTRIGIRKQIAFVAQDDSLQITATPREAIYFSAKLRLPRSTPESALQSIVDRMLEELGLLKCADTLIGGALIKGISGGERKRTSVGVELVVRPTIVCLDEPTSGLDSFSAAQLCQVLKKVANAGSSVLLTIHQPASEIFSSFDRLILMNHGQVMYQGPVTEVPAYFEQRGQPVPPLYNPADHIMNVAQNMSKEDMEQTDFLMKAPLDISEEDGGEAGLTTVQNDQSGRNDIDSALQGMGTQTLMLFLREIQNLRRDTDALGARMGLTVVMSTLIGIIFLNVGETDSSDVENLNSHFGALIMMLLLSMMGTAQTALLSFPQERPVFVREYSTNHYSIVPYFMSRLAMEAGVTAAQALIQLLITYFMIGLQGNFGILYLLMYTMALASSALAVTLGCAVEDPKMAQEMLPMLFVPQMLFAGFFVRPRLIPSWLRWVRYVCSLTYAVRIALVEEFAGVCVGGDEADANCDDLLNSINANEDETWWNWIVLVSIFIVFRLFAVTILQRKASPFS